MKDFKDLYESAKNQQSLTEARSRGEEMEEFIIAAINKEPQPASKFGIEDGAGERIARQLRKQGVKGKGRVLGADQLEVTELWSQYWLPGKVPASTKTPKTDFIIGNHKMSLKTGGAAQLMSGGRNESVATFYAAVDRLGLNLNGLASRIEKAMLDLSPSSIAQSDLKSEIKLGKDKVVKAANEAHKTLMADMKKLFASNPDFAYEFAYEAMTGDVKFGGSDGTCSHFLSVSDDGNTIKLVGVGDEAYVRKVASKMKVSVRFKTTSEKTGGVKTGRYRYWSAIGLIVDKLTESYEEIGQLLAEGTLDENLLKRAFNKFLGFLRKMMGKIKEFVVKSAKNLIEFLGATPEISFNNNIDFTKI